MATQTALFAAIAALVAICVGMLGVVALISAMAFMIRPWDGSVRKDYSWVAGSPYPVFWLGTWIARVGIFLQSLKPGPLRAAEFATAYLLSQAIFMLGNLGIPDLLLSGPRSADDLAANVGPAVHPDRLARVLDFAAAFGMINRKRIRCRNHRPQRSAVNAVKTALLQGNTRATCAGGVQAPAVSHTSRQLREGLLEADTNRTVLTVNAVGKDAEDVSTFSTTSNTTAITSSSSSSQYMYVYSLNAVSACLTSESPVCVADMVKMFEDHYAGFQRFSEGMRDGQIPFELAFNGKSFWQHIADSPRHAQTFDLAMAQINQLGGPAAAAQYPFNSYETVIDVAGGVGGFLAEVLRRHEKPRGVVFDQLAQIERAHKLWASEQPYKSLAARVQLVGGDMFEPSTIPSPTASGGGKVAYVLRNILHDWPDADCLTILSNIRRCVTAADISRVRLLIIEPTSMETPCRNIYPHRLQSDLLMLASFGDAKERNKQQFNTLLEATGWKLNKIVPTNGIFLVLEAVPV